MTEPTTTPAEPTSENQPPAVANQTEQNPIPYSRFQEVNNKAKELEVKLAEFQTLEATRKADAEKAENARLAEQQQFKELAEKHEATAKQLAETLTPYKEKWEAVLTATTERNKARVEAIPEAKRTLVPEYEDPMKLAKWLDSNEKQLTEDKRNLGGGSPRTGRVNGKVPTQPITERSPIPSFSRF